MSNFEERQRETTSPHMEPSPGDHEGWITPHWKWSSGGVAYHSIDGALTESEHVFIDRGLERWWSDKQGKTACIRVLEVGFGTGLNAALAWQWAERRGVALEYVGLEPFPLEPDEVEAWATSGLPDDIAQRMDALHKDAAGPEGLWAQGFFCTPLAKHTAELEGRRCIRCVLLRCFCTDPAA